MNVTPLALLALVPMITGPLPQEERALVIGLCLGGEITIPLGDNGKDHERGCHIEGCHAGNCREKPKRTAKFSPNLI